MLYSSALLRVCLLPIFLLCVVQSHAQLFSGRGAMQGNQGMSTPGDSSRKKQFKTNDSIQLYTFTYQDSMRHSLDSSVGDLHKNPLMGIWETDLGNFGSAAHSVFFNPSLSPSNQLGLFADTAFLFRHNATRFYNTTRPYSDLYYRIGTKQEQIVQIIHSRNVNARLNFTLMYRKSGSPGSYKIQRTNNDNLELSSNYQAKNQRYFMQAVLIYNKIQQDENGGILSYDYLYASNYKNKRLVPVMLSEISGVKNRSTMLNYYRDLNFHLQHQYFFGLKDSLMSADSSERIYRFKPTLGFKHEVYATADAYRFKDLAPDSLYYSMLGTISFPLEDSVYNQYYFQQMGTAFSLSGDLRANDHVLQSEAGYGVEWDKIDNGSYHTSYINNYIKASIHKRADHDHEWLYQGNLKMYLSGNLIGNLHLNAEAGRNFSDRLGQIRVGFDQAVQHASLLDTHYESSYYLLQADTKRQIITQAHFRYQNTPFKTFLQFNYFLMANYIYRDTSLQVQQANHVIPLYQAHLYKAFKLGSVVFSNHLLLQWLDSHEPIHVPLFSCISRLAYEKRILSNKLDVAAGVECRYNTPYYADQYSPLLYNFVTQYNNKISNVPRTTCFFNFKVKTFRGSLSLDEIQQLFTRNYVPYPMYAAPNFMFRFGFHWMFVN